MCGITGLLSCGSNLAADSVVAMTNTLKYRGPDDEGYLAVDTRIMPMNVTQLRGPASSRMDMPSYNEFSGEANLYLGHRRLAILDLSAAGHQPAPYGASLWMVYNGEIYNYRELRQELKSAGYRFTTETDTEVLLAAYAHWGEACVSHFNGDWAFCILDIEQRTLFLSRDRYGVKPLYFFHTDACFAFASEIKALLSLPFISRSLNHQMASHYLTLHCLDHTAETFFQHICQLLPGQNMRVDLQTGTMLTWPYYRLEYCPEIGEYSHQQARAFVADIRDLLFDAVRLRLRADVPVGTCLSGGLDSSSIVAIMAKILGTESDTAIQKTFTAAFPGEAIDETRFAQLVVEQTAASSHMIYPTRERCYEALPALLHHQDEPVAGPSVYAQWEVMREASRHVKVVLDGQGGDEVFAGYRNYRVSFLAHLLTQGRLRSLATEFWGTIAGAKGLRAAIAEVKALPFFALSDSWKRRIYTVYSRAGKLGKLGSDRDGNQALEHLVLKFSANMNVLLFNYMMRYSLPHLLKWEDRNSMAHSIEARVPFTDYRLVDYVFRLPSVYKIRHGWTKWLLRLAVEDLLPKEIVWRRDKLGFAAPPWISRQQLWDVWRQQNVQG